ncbi:diguanylate cyclase domain-containing protein [Hoeflea ulvae]|uniref:Diguanylate cyclase n=1 Tax=Hoeflea ulvae TaxID=2983764 RepID=A0ABT3YE15_9HYPH|nr:diguanylate cyclase [Hoeflea ulvae]MCY0094134.1 diguanylate cyclase [Hoeflea ulvae]
MSKPNPTTSSIGPRVATAMYQMGINGLPRNYELVYEAYSGTNPELTREFVAIGKTKSQRALDELGKKYLPHHHEETVVAKTSDLMQAQMGTLMDLLEQEKLSLSDYSKIIDEASRSFAAAAKDDLEALARSAQALTQATEHQATKSEALGKVAARQAAELEEIKSDFDKSERLKFVDSQTGLANRRAFNKATAGIYANPGQPVLCGLAYAQIDDFRRFGEAGDKGLGDLAIRHIGCLLNAGNKTREFVTHLDGNRFAVLIKSGTDSEVMRVVDGLRAAAQSRPMVHPKTGAPLGHPTLSIGVAMSAVTSSFGQLSAYAENAVTASTKEGGNRTTLYSNTAHAESAKGWIIYQAK